MNYLWDLLEYNYKGEDKSLLTVTWPVSWVFEIEVVKAYLQVLETLKDDRFSDCNAS